MKPTYTNAPMNLTQKREEPALKTLIIMISVIALMFGIRIFCAPQDAAAEIAAASEACEENEENSPQAVF